MSLLKKIVGPSLQFSRGIKKRLYIWKGEGIQYPGFRYYPRKPDFQDPPYEATKLFRVELIKPFKDAPYWERNILKEFKFEGKINSVVIVKNIPENNQRLWRVKHMIKITPITYPDGFPENDDVTFLEETGKLRIIKKMSALDESKLQLTENFQKDIKKLDGDTLRRQSRLKWLSGWETLC